MKCATDTKPLGEITACLLGRQASRSPTARRHRPHQPSPVAPGTRPPGSVQPQPIPQSHNPAPPSYSQPPADESGLAPLAASADDYEHYSRPTAPPHPQTTSKKRLAPKIPIKFLIVGAVALLLIAAGGYLLTRPAQKSGFSMAQLSKKSTFGFYHPQPLPSGYAYETKINAFQDGQAYFMLANGSKHIIFHEQAASGQTTGGLTAATSTSSPAGKASIGTLAGQPAAKVLTGSTFISINTTGAVPPADLSQAINSLKTDL